MRTIHLIVISVLFVGLGLPAGAAVLAAEDEVLGTWVVKEQVRGREGVATLAITESGGVWKTARGSVELSDVEIGEGEVTFTRNVSRGGRSSSMVYRASIVDGSLVGKVTSPQGESEFTATRMPESQRVAIEEREAAIAELESCDILAVFAHPDDETFATGTFSKLSAKGQCVQLVYATSGGAGGDRSGRGLSGAALAKEGEQEMRNAAKVLGVAREPLLLRYPDGYVYENWSGVLASVQSILEKTHPSVVVTFGPDGYYGHEDHRAIGQIAGRAFDDSGVPSHLLHDALSRSKNDFIVSAGGGDRYQPVDDKFITYTVDVSGQLEQRIAAMQAHKTQFDERTVSQYRLLATLKANEEFVEVRNPGGAGMLSDLFSN